MALSRMELGDASSIDELVKGILRMIPDLPVPTPIEDIARGLDIGEIKLLDTDSFEGMLATDAARSFGAIFINANRHPFRRRFSIGHELAHFLCRWHKSRREGDFRCSPADMAISAANKTDPHSRYEAEANRFAAHLLMPEAPFKRSLRAYRDLDLNHALALAKAYQTSKEATARRYAELHDEPCGIIVSQNGQVLRFYRGGNFPWIEGSRKGDAIPHESLTARASQPHGYISQLSEVPGTVWFSSGVGQKPPKTYEQVLVQSDGYRLTLLAIDDVSENEEEDEGLLESYEIRFHKKRRR